MTRNHSVSRISTRADPAAEEARRRCPTSVPMTIEITVAASPTSREIRAPQMNSVEHGAPEVVGAERAELATGCAHAGLPVALTRVQARRVGEQRRGERHQRRRATRIDEADHPGRVAAELAPRARRRARRRRARRCGGPSGAATALITCRTRGSR